MRAAIEVALQRPREIEEYRNVLASLGEQCERLTSLVNSEGSSVERMACFLTIFGERGPSLSKRGLTVSLPTYR
jgi:hypothetical protein